MVSIAVIDVETTGLNPYRHDRVIEIASVVVSADGTIIREFSTLINPERDIGPSHIHGLGAGDVLAAPKFSDVVGGLTEFLSGCVALAGHNVRFDLAFLGAEFARAGYLLPACPSLCSMKLAGGGRLVDVCSEFEIDMEGNAHSALIDARATARLLAVLLNDAPRLQLEVSSWQAISWPEIPVSEATLMTREEFRRIQSQPPAYLQKLMSRIAPEIPTDADDSACLAYSVLLERVLQDRHIDEAEGDALLEFATRWNILAAQIDQMHRDFLLRLAVVALADGKVTDAERRDLQKVATLLGIDSCNLNALMDVANEKLNVIQSSPAVVPASILRGGGSTGKRVCFTGECACRFGGEVITRGLATQLATQKGLVVTESVSRKLDLLIVADPLTQSGKAKKSRQYGIPIIQETVFWRELGVEVE